MSDRSLLPFILPNVFHIARSLSGIEFTSSVLPRLQPLFSVQDPPQNQLMLLDQIDLFVSKTTPQVFREGVTPLLYSSLEAEQPNVQERALQQVPRLCEVLDFSHVKETLFPRIAVVFSKTKVLSVKVNTLIAFHQMVSLLDKHTLAEKLVPLLARIKTREPSVMVATLAVHEALASKVDRETLAVEIIPQLWAMSMGPLLNAEQFEKFMRATREMGEKVAKEHLAHLKEVKRMQEHTDQYNHQNGRSTTNAAGGGSAFAAGGGEVDFATLVGSGKDSGVGVARDVNAAKAPATSSALPFDPFAFDDLNAAGASTSGAATPVLTPAHTGTGGVSSSLRPTQATRPALNGVGRTASSSSSSSFTSPFPAPTPTSSTSGPSRSGSFLRQGPPTASTSSSASSLRPTPTASAAKPAPLPPPGWSAGSTLVPMSSSSSSSGTASGMAASASGGGSTGPNYNISLPSATGFGGGGGSSNVTAAGPDGAGGSNGGGSLSMASFSGLPPLVPQTSSLGSMSPMSGSGAGGGAAARPAMPSIGSGVLQPTRKTTSTTGAGAGQKQTTMAEFDPFA